MGGPEELAKEFGIYFIVKCLPVTYLLQRKTGAMKSHTVSRTDVLSCIWAEGAGLCNRSPPHRSCYMLATLFKAVVACKVTVTPHATLCPYPRATAYHPADG